MPPRGPRRNLDISNNEQIKSALNDRSFEVIFHVASLPGDTGDPRQMMDVNVNGLLNLLEFAKEKKDISKISTWY